jgi:glutathione synthase/RimK-type ligase-like ATP-grasp enzyme
MLEAPWKREEERRFLEDPRGVLGPEAYGAVEAIGRRLDLDYAGLDFTLLADGRILVFEANATMLVHLDDAVEDFPYKHAVVPAIYRAFEAMLERAGK